MIYLIYKEYFLCRIYIVFIMQIRPRFCKKQRRRLP